MPSTTPPQRAPEKRSNCFCREEPMLVMAVTTHVNSEVLSPGQKTALKMK